MKTVDQLTEFEKFEQTFDYEQKDCRPSLHEAGCILLHPMRVLPGFKPPTLTEPGVPAYWRQANFDAVKSGGKLIKWKEFAVKNGLNIKDGFSLGAWCQQLGNKWPKNTLIPPNGIIDKSVLVSLLGMLSKFSAKGETHFFYFDAMKMRNHEQVELFSGKIEEVLSFGAKNRVTMTPTIWYPESKSWRVYSSEEAYWSYVTGSKLLVSALMASKDIECVELSVLD